MLIESILLTTEHVNNFTVKLQCTLNKTVFSSMDNTCQLIRSILYHCTSQKVNLYQSIQTLHCWVSSLFQVLRIQLVAIFLMLSELLMTELGAYLYFTCFASLISTLNYVLSICHQTCGLTYDRFTFTRV